MLVKDFTVTVDGWTLSVKPATDARGLPMAERALVSPAQWAAVIGHMNLAAVALVTPITKPGTATSGEGAPPG